MMPPVFQNLSAPSPAHRADARISPKAPLAQAVGKNLQNRANGLLKMEIHKHLQSVAKRKAAARAPRVKLRPKGWSPQRRARQAALIRSWAPWQGSTGPKPRGGKARCVMNALRHGLRSRAYSRRRRAKCALFRRARFILRVAARKHALIRAFLR